MGAVLLLVTVAVISLAVGHVVHKWLDAGKAYEGAPWDRPEIVPLLRRFRLYDLALRLLALAAIAPVMALGLCLWAATAVRVALVFSARWLPRFELWCPQVFRQIISALDKSWLRTRCDVLSLQIRTIAGVQPNPLKLKHEMD